MRSLFATLLLLVAISAAATDAPRRPGQHQGQNQDQLSEVNTIIDFGDSPSTYSADYEEATHAVAVSGSECSGSFAVGTKDVQIGAAGPSPFCQKLASAREDRNTAKHTRETAAAMTCAAPHELNKSGDAWLPNECLTEKHRLMVEAKALEVGANETLTNARRDANKKPGLLGKIWRVIGF